MSKQRIVHVRLRGTPLPSGTATSRVHKSSCCGQSLPAGMWWPCSMRQAEALCFYTTKGSFFRSLKQSLADADYCTSNSLPLWGTQNSSISLHIVGAQLMDGWVDHIMVQSPPELQWWPRELGTHKIWNFFFPQITLPVQCYSHNRGQSWEGQVSCNPNSGMLYRRKNVSPDQNYLLSIQPGYRFLQVQKHGPVAEARFHKEMLGEGSTHGGEARR